jgi:hypothetical protein
MKRCQYIKQTIKFIYIAAKKMISIYQKPDSLKPIDSITLTMIWKKNMKKNNMKFIELSVLFNEYEG